MVSRRIVAFVVTLSALSSPALGGPPYVTDDPAPTDYKHFEIYLFNAGTAERGGIAVASGLDFNYGAAPDLQLTAVVPVSFNNPSGGRTATGLGNVELAAKYRFLHQEDFGWDVAVFPRVFLPAGSPANATPRCCCRYGSARIGAIGPPSAAADARSTAAGLRRTSA